MNIKTTFAKPLNMKLLSIFILLIPISGIAQEKIKGIGPFKMGEATTSIIETISSETGVKIASSGSSLDVVGPHPFDKKTKQIMELIRDEKAEYPNLSAPEIPQQRIFYIDYYEVAEVPITEIYLKFWNDTLYDFTCNPKNVIEAVKLKYGDPLVKREEKTVMCRSKMGVEYKETELSFISTWKNTADSIACHSYLAKYFNAKCEAILTSYFTITDNRTTHHVTKMKAEFSNKKKEEEDKAKKKKLTDF